MSDNWAIGRSQRYTVGVWVGNAGGAKAQWLPCPGRHVVQLQNERCEVQDEVRVEVRGAGVKVASRQ